MRIIDLLTNMNISARNYTKAYPGNESLTVGFINYVAGWCGVNYGMYVSDLKKEDHTLVLSRYDPETKGWLIMRGKEYAKEGELEFILRYIEYTIKLI